eukprot:CAMPEP_0202479848 /NCGR_PEP_ID=MMETSP1361-20130828/27_1 /ASSEMBLY_ACC=CAM_ASM_000849 /TAXON_ID=210615 /ORGANISM="Staurosira complex sp., Strain CCMP2646" /LENGTH=184 /DNA_ID=CAMNT_0049107203 /DNA_START=48 /DNA_END=602 /DNA_ORIENTATION=-
MKLAIVATLVAGAAAFAPSYTGSRASTCLNAEFDRRAAFGQIAIGAGVLAGIPSLASADGAVSAATITKAKAVYGDRIAKLKSAVEKGDFSAVVDEKNAFILFNSGAYPTAKDKSKKAESIALTNQIFSAIRSKDAAGVKKAYSDYVKFNGVKEIQPVDPNAGQGYSSDYSYLARTPAAAIYVR